MEHQTAQIKGSITVGMERFEVHYYDNPTARSLIARMPFEANLEDYARMEKIFYPKPPLNLEKAPEGAKPSAGDIMYYSPWGDVAIFYKDFRFANGLIPLGRIEAIDEFLHALQTDGSEVSFKADN